MNHEEKLQAIIEQYGIQFLGDWSLNKKGFIDTNYHRVHILQILLDTEGLKEAYGEGPSVEDETIEVTTTENVNVFVKTNNLKHPTKPRYKLVSESILDAWHSGNGNNWQKAIDVSYNFLPNDDL